MSRRRAPSQFGLNDGYIEMKITGLKEMNELFKQLPEAVGKRTLKKSLMAAAQPLVANLKSRAPVEHRATYGPVNRKYGGQPGDLKKSMRARFLPSEDATTANVLAGTPLWYAHFTNNGTRTQPGQHYMEAAWQASLDPMISTFVEQCGKNLDVAIRKYGSKKRT